MKTQSKWLGILEESREIMKVELETIFGRNDWHVFMLYIRGHAGSTTNYRGCCSHPPVGT